MPSDAQENVRPSHLVSADFRDKAIVDGIYEPELVPKPLIPVSDAVGVVVAVGPGVTNLKEGDRVNSHLYSAWVDGNPKPNELAFCYGTPLPGGLAEYMILNAATAVKAPAAMTDEEASTLPIAALTAWYSMMDYGHLQPGQTVLAQGTGGVSVFAIQIASALGARVIATSSRDENLEKVKALGAWQTINYRRHPEWEKKALELTDGSLPDEDAHEVDLCLLALQKPNLKDLAADAGGLDGLIDPVASDDVQ